MKITISQASTPKEILTVQNMFVAYLFDMSQYDDNLVINTFGLPTWAPSGLPGPRTLKECVRLNWWIRDLCELYLTRADGSPAGFSIVCRDHTHLPPEVDVELMDFYIAPKYRRQQVGWQAAKQVFDLYHGVWQVFELKKNKPALTFWHKLIAEYTGGQFEDLDDGTQQRFHN